MHPLPLHLLHLILFFFCPYLMHQEINIMGLKNEALKQLNQIIQTMLIIRNRHALIVEQINPQEDLQI